MADYDKVGLLAVRGGKVLLCRKKYTTNLLLLPGGCRERGESSIDCLKRELQEELGKVEVTDLEYLGTYTDRAAGEESTKTVEIELYRGNLAGDAAPHSEIKELVWFSLDGDYALLAPSLRNKIFPDLRTRGLL